MLDKSQEELDNLFRREPELAEFEYNSESWAKMEEMLDKDKRRKLIIWLFVGISALAALGLFYMNSNKNISSSLLQDVNNGTIKVTEGQEV